MKTRMCVALVVAILLAAAAAAEAADQIEAAKKFLIGWGKGNWEDVAAVAAPTVKVSAGGKEATIDVAAKTADAVVVLPFRGLSTVRDAQTLKVTAVTVSEIVVKIGGEETKGQGTLTVEEKDGGFTVSAVAVQ